MSKKIYLSILLVWLLCADTDAQIDVGGGLQVGFPLMFNKTVGNYHHALASFGSRLSATYLPKESGFVPNIVVSMAQLDIPVARLTDNNVVAMGFFGISAMVNGRFRRVWEQKELQYGAGIGLTYFSGNSTSIHGRGGEEIVVNFSNTDVVERATPMANINAEYIFPISNDAPLSR